MKHFLNMKIGAKLAFGFGIVAFLSVLISAFGLMQMNEIANVVKVQNAARTKKLEQLYIVREALGQTGLAARNAFIFQDDISAKKELDVVDQQKKIYLDALALITPLFRGN